MADEPEKDDGKSVLLDANALMMQFQFYLDIERELQRVIPGPFTIVVPSSVVDELQVLGEHANQKTAEEARLSIALAKTFKVIEAPGTGDQAIIKLAEKLGNTVVVTNDKLLRARLRAKGIPNVHMRSKAFLSVEGFPGF